MIGQQYIDTLKDLNSPPILAGFDYPVSETVSVGLRARWMRSGEFAGTVVWDPLRSHVPNLRRDGSEPVDGTMSTDGFSL